MPESSDQQLQQGFWLGEFQVEPLSGTVFGSGGEFHLQPKTMDVLVYLSAHSGAVVTRDELLRSIWGERAVSDEPLTRCITQLRSVLNDSTKQPKFIETIPKRGYRLIVTPDMRAAEETAEPFSPSKQKFSNWRSLLVITAVVLVILAVWVFPIVNKKENVLGTDVEARHGLAILPFKNLSDGTVDEYFGYGIAEELINHLVRTPGLRIVSRSSSFQFADESTPIKEIAQRLNVTHILRGSVRSNGDNVRISIQLIDTRNDDYIWSETYERVLTNIIDLQTEIANDATAALAPVFNLGAIERSTQTIVSTSNAEAYQNYLHAIFLGDNVDARSVDRARILLEKAIQLDPEFAEAYAELSFIYTILADVSTNWTHDVTLPLAKKNAEQALALNERLTVPRVVIAKLYATAANWIEAEREFQNVLAINPADLETLNSYSQLLARVGKHEAATEMMLEVKDRDPVSMISNDWLTYLYFVQGDYELAKSYANDAIDSGSHWSAITLYRMYVYLGDLERAEQALIYKLNNLGKTDDVAASVVKPLFAGLRESDKYDAAVESVPALASLFGWPRRSRINFYLDLGAVDNAAKELIENPDIGDAFIVNRFWLPQYGAFRVHPKFKDIVRRLGLESYWRTNGWNDYCKPIGEDDFTCN